MTLPPPDDRRDDDSQLSTATLLERIRQGDRDSREELCARYLPRLKRWAHGRVPRGGGSIANTDDLVQLTLIRALSHLETFEPRREGAFIAYLRMIILNQIRDEVRRMKRNPPVTDLDGTLADPGPSPLEEVIGREMLERYERALAVLSAEQREAIQLRLEQGWTYQEIAEALGRPTPTAARMLIQRALARLAREMHEYR